MINAEDFKAWLNDPCTQFFQQWIIKNRDELKQDGINRVYNNSHKVAKDENAAALFEVCKGLDCILDTLGEVKNQVIEEIKAQELEEKDRPEIADKIGDMIEYTYSKDEE
jgi:hypothetical protein